jgi:hypothetical protein
VIALAIQNEAARRLVVDEVLQGSALESEEQLAIGACEVREYPKLGMGGTALVVPGRPWHSIRLSTPAPKRPIPTRRDCSKRSDPCKTASRPAGERV